MPKWNKLIEEQIIPAHSIVVEVYKIGIDYTDNKLFVKTNDGEHTFPYDDLPPQVQNWFDNAVDRAETTLGFSPSDRIEQVLEKVKVTK